MAHRRTMGGVILDDSLTRVRISSPLRRRSLAAPATPIALQRDIITNDDEREILARRRQPTPMDNSKTSETSDRRISLSMMTGLSVNDIMEHYNKCLKLSVENKINSKNVFALSMIDYMSVLNKRDKNSNNMQTAVKSLDVGTKIYGVRVDCIYLDTFKMAGDPGVQEKNKDHGETEADDAADSTNNETLAVKQKSKRAAQPTRCSDESLDDKIETLNLMVKINNGDTQTTDMLNMVNFPVHAHNGYGLHLYEDVLLDFPIDRNNAAANVDCEVEINGLEDLGESKICKTLTDFTFLGWTQADIPLTPPRTNGTMLPTENGQAEDEMRFDLDASLVNGCNDDNGGMNYFDLDEATQENVDRCGRMGGEEGERIVDFRESVVEKEKEQQSNVEYSFAQKTVEQFHWAGPMRWKRISVPKIVNGSRVIGACRQESARKKKEVALDQTLDFIEDFRYKLKHKIPRKLQSRTLRQAWQEEKVTLPEDVHYDSINPIKLYLHELKMQPLIQEQKANHAENNENGNTLLDQACENYEYDNLNDTQDYCSQNNATDDIGGDDNAGEIENGHQDNDRVNHNGLNDLCSQGFTGGNLVALPRSTTQVQIAYSTRAKRIDMRQLKRSLWKALINENGTGGRDKAKSSADADASRIKEERNFSTVYKNLPDLLGKDNAEALSPALAFASLLHLANEKNLNIISAGDMSDLKIAQG